MRYAVIRDMWPCTPGVYVALETISEDNTVVDIQERKHREMRPSNKETDR